MFIEVAKITRDKRKNRVAESRSVFESDHLPNEIKIVVETIRKDEVRSVRRWYKSREEELTIEGDVTMVYLFGNNDDATEMKINESYDSFTRRLAVVKIEE